MGLDCIESKLNERLTKLQWSINTYYKLAQTLNMSTKYTHIQTYKFKYALENMYD